MIPNLLTIFLHGYEVKPGRGLGTRLGFVHMDWNKDLYLEVVSQARLTWKREVTTFV